MLVLVVLFFWVGYKNLESLDNWKWLGSSRQKETEWVLLEICHRYHHHHCWLIDWFCCFFSLVFWLIALPRHSGVCMEVHWIANITSEQTFLILMKESLDSYCLTRTCQIVSFFFWHHPNTYFWCTCFLLLCCLFPACWSSFLHAIMLTKVTPPWTFLFLFSCKIAEVNRIVIKPLPSAPLPQTTSTSTLPQRHSQQYA